MKGVVHRRAAARRDLVSIYRRYANDAGLTVADRFLAAAETTFRSLAVMPALGTSYPHDHRALAELRYFPLASPFKTYLVFYRPVADGITVVRVLHGARDIRSILAEEFDIDQDTGGEDEGDT